MDCMLVSRLSDFLEPAWEAIDSLGVGLGSSYVTQEVAITGAPLAPAVIELHLSSMDDSGDLKQWVVRYPRDEWHDAARHIVAVVTGEPTVTMLKNAPIHIARPS